MTDTRISWRTDGLTLRPGATVPRPDDPERLVEPDFATFVDVRQGGNQWFVRARWEWDGEQATSRRATLTVGDARQKAIREAVSMMESASDPQGQGPETGIDTDGSRDNGDNDIAIAKAAGRGAKAIRIVGDVPEAVLLPFRAGHDDERAAFQSSVQDTVETKLSTNLSNIPEGARLGTLRFPGGSNWVVEPNLDVEGRQSPRMTVADDVTVEEGDVIEVRFFNSLSRSEDTVSGGVSRIGTSPEGGQIYMGDPTGDDVVIDLSEREVRIDGARRGRLLRGESGISKPFD